MSKDSLGDRMKRYESTYQTRIVDRMYTLIRLDGKAFHTYTRGLKKPFDRGLTEDMVATTKYLCENVQGCKVGYTQSDEITLVLTDFDDHKTTGWFDNELEKICSISASMASSKFNHLRMKRHLREISNDVIMEPKHINEDMDIPLAQFDSRVFQVSILSEVYNNLLWRQQDCIRNSVSSSAQSLYSHKELHLKNVPDMQALISSKSKEFHEKIIACGYDPKFKNLMWNWLPEELQNGTFFSKETDKREFPEAVYLKAANKNEGFAPGWIIVDSPEGPKYMREIKVWKSKSTKISGNTYLLNPFHIPINQ